MLEKTMQQLERMLCARSIAVVGASANPEKWGYMFLHNLLLGGYTGKLFAVNPKAERILGVPGYPSVRDIPDSVDLLIITVPIAAAFEAIAQGIEKGVQGAALITAGFREMGRDDLEQHLAEMIAGSGFRVIGPNIAGLNYLPNAMSANVTMVFDEAGPISIVSQSGSVSAIIGQWAQEEGIGLTALINLGNQADLCETDFLAYLLDQPDTKVVALYLEGVKDRKNFKTVLPRVCREKPVVVLKPGKTELGKKVAGSHTASIAGDDKVFSFACRQYGAVRAEDLESFFDFSKFFAMNPLPGGNRVFTITSSGGVAGLIADEMAGQNLAMPGFDKAVGDLFAASVRISMAHFYNNPVDMPSFTPKDYCTILEIADRYDLADMYLVSLADPVPEIEFHLPAMLKKTRKPCAVIYAGGGEYERQAGVSMQRQGIPVYHSPERAVRSMAAAFWYAQRREELCHG